MKVTREAHVAAFETRSTRSEETERHVIQPTKSEKQVDQVSHSGVGPSHENKERSKAGDGGRSQRTARRSRIA